MSKLKELQAQRDQLNAQIKSERARQSANQQYYYALFFNSDNIPEVKMVNEKPKSGNYAQWVGQKGSKSLKSFGKFEEKIASLNAVTGFACARIKPMLIKHGYTWNPQGKAWVR